MNASRSCRQSAFPIAALLAVVPALAQQYDSPIDKMFSWASASTPGCTVAASHHGKVVVNRAYGLADLERNVPISSETVFDAASVVKQFVAASILLLAEEGRVSLVEDVHKYIPELPDYGHRITLDHLMTHTSGIRDWTGLGPLTGRYIDALSLTLRQRGLNFKPGEEFSYSNSGYVLLKEIVARTSGLSFADFTRKRLFEPFGMKNTLYVDNLRTIIRNRALAYEKAGNGWTMDVQFDNDRGGGGALFSTAADLLVWNSVLSNARLGPFVTAKLQEPARLNNGRKLGYGRGLFLDTTRGMNVLWHSGGSGGYGTFLARFPEQDLSVATMCNAGESATGSVYARRIVDLLLPVSDSSLRAETPPASAGSASIEDRQLKSKAGLFFSESDGQPLRLSAAGGRLRILGGPVLDAVSPDRFRNPRGVLRFMSQDEFELTFVSPDVLELKSMEGATTRYRRAASFAPAADELEAFAGRYGNDEVRTAFEVEPGKAGLIIRIDWNDKQASEFRPVDRDTFQMAGMIVRFRRNKTGVIESLDYSNPVVRNIRFTRLK